MIDSAKATCYCWCSARYFQIELSKLKLQSNHCNEKNNKYSLTLRLNG